MSVTRDSSLALGDDAPRPKIAICEDNQLLASVLAGALRDAFEVTGVFTARDHARHGLLLNCPDLVIMDVYLGKDDGVELAEELCEHFPDVRIVFLSEYLPVVPPSHFRHAERASFLIKSRIDGPGLIEAVTTALRWTVVDPLCVEDRFMGTVGQLDPMQRRILAELAVGHSNLHIADSLGLTIKAVEGHLTRIYRRLGVTANDLTHSRVQAARLYWDFGRPRAPESSDLGR